jgi:UDP-N-acetylmuramate--alanine ligase
MDADHLDIYGTSEAIENLLLNLHLKLKKKQSFITKLPLEGVTCSVNEDAVFKAFNRIGNGSYVFDVQTPTEVIKICILVCQGRHNLMNALMAING